MGERVRGWRKLAGSSWGAPGDPQFYGELEIDASAMLSYAKQIRERTGIRLTMTHLVGRAPVRLHQTGPSRRGAVDQRPVHQGLRGSRH